MVTGSLRVHLCETVEFREEVCVTALITFSNVVTYLLSSQSGSFGKRLGLGFPFRVHRHCRVNWDTPPLSFLFLFPTTHK